MLAFVTQIEKLMMKGHNVGHSLRLTEPSTCSLTFCTKVGLAIGPKCQGIGPAYPKGKLWD